MIVSVSRWWATMWSGIGRAAAGRGRWIALFLVFSCPAVLPAQSAPRPMAFSEGLQHIGALGVSCKYKRASGPDRFGGDMLVWGTRAFGGKKGDLKLGASGGIGMLNGTYRRLHVRMAGLTVEHGFRPDPLFKWRVGFGGGNYDLKSTISDRSISKGSFTYLEPSIIGIRPFSRHIALEVGAGYTFCGAKGGVKLEGLFLEATLLMGRFDF